VYWISPPVLAQSRRVQQEQSQMSLMVFDYLLAVAFGERRLRAVQRQSRAAPSRQM